MSGGLLDRVEEDEQVEEVIEEVLSASTDAGLLSREKSVSEDSSKEITMTDSLKMIGLVMIIPYFLMVKNLFPN